VALIIPREVGEQLLDAQGAMDALRPVMVEEAAGTTLHMPPFGGSKSARPTFRLVGGGLYGMQRMGVRAGATQLFDTETGRLLAIVGGATQWRVAATMGLGAQYLARPDAARVGLLGSGRNALPILQCLALVRPIDRVDLFSPTPAHRERLAEQATQALNIPVTAHDNPRPAIADADILVVGTSSYSPVVSFSDLHPGMHVTSMGMSVELDESVYLQVDQVVAPSAEQEIDSHNPIAAPHIEGVLYQLVNAGRWDSSRIVELGSIIEGEVPARNGADDINLFRESRGGPGDIALANWVYERARERGLGVEIDL